MITNRTRGLYLLHFAAQTTAAAVLFWSWVWVCFWLVRAETILAWTHYASYSLAALAGLGFDFLRAGGTSQNFLDLSGRRNRVHSLRQAVTALLGVLLFIVATQDQMVSRVFLFTFFPLLYVLLVATNRWVPRLLATWSFTGKRRHRTVILGSAVRAERLRPWLEHKVRYGLETVGLVSDEPGAELDLALPLLGREEDLAQVLEESHARQLLVAGLPTMPRIAELGTLCDRLGIHLLIMNDLEEHVGRPLSFVHDAGLRFLSLRDEPLECPFNRMMKRTVDIALSLPVVLFVLPFTSVVVSICHRLQSPGPLLFRQKRTGIGGEDFLIYKYRSMHVANFDEAQQATAADPRVFRAGALFRKLSVDELPQFINVLRGDMSIVGPRPHLRQHDEAFSSVAHSYRVRARIRPGITGLAQVRGHRGEARHTEEIVSRVDSDLFYLENWSILLDTTIMLRTVAQMIFPPRAAV